MKGDGNLKIDNVDIKDGGDWTCYNSDTNSTGNFRIFEKLSELPKFSRSRLQKPGKSKVKWYIKLRRPRSNLLQKGLISISCLFQVTLAGLRDLDFLTNFTILGLNEVC